jgi:ubiquinone biosynthesis monooxygenase Coq7
MTCEPDSSSHSQARQYALHSSFGFARWHIYICGYNVAMTHSPAVPIAAPTSRRETIFDRLIGHADAALRTLTGVTGSARPYPAAGQIETVKDKAEQREVCALMRINHAGEVSAQALYQGQALTARDAVARAAMNQAAREEADHLAWCATRLKELGGRPSLFNPLWYAGSFAIGAVAGLAGDRTSLGFLAETERQVVDHLEGHLARLPNGDSRTRTILRQMTSDEASHRDMAVRAGGTRLPLPITRLMSFASSVMTRTARWI